MRHPPSLPVNPSSRMMRAHRNRLTRAAAVFLLLAGVLASRQSPAQVRRPRLPAPPQGEAQIRVEVNLVTVLASVTDAKGRPVAELSRGAFEIYEEGVPQKLELFEAETSQPLDLVLMVDTSMSTLGELAFIQEAAAHFVRQVVRPGDRLAVFEFDSSVTQLSEFSSHVRDLQAAIRAAQPGAGTSLYDAVYLGADALRSRPYGRRRVLVLITDAGETTSDASFEEARRAALRSEALLYTIIINPVRTESGRNTAGEHALLTITDVTGGMMYKPEAAELSDIFDRIDRELRTQYRLGYYPEPQPPPRSHRRIEVRVLPQKPAAGKSTAQPAAFFVRHRKGYLTGPFD